MNNLRYIQYSRKSSEAKEKQALSIPEQNIECEKYSKEHNLQIVEKIEESKTAFKPHKRLGFDRMMALLESGQADGILEWHLNRLARNPEEGGKILQLLQDGIIKEIRTASGEIYTPDSDHFILQIHFGMANQYSRNISRDVKRSLVHKAERGEYPRRAILGYETIGERGSKNLKPHPTEAQLIRKASEMAATKNYSLNYICNFLHKNGLRTKNGKRIGKSHLYSILTNIVYTGHFFYQGELYKGTYQPIVSKPLFDRVQKALKDRSKAKINTWDKLYNGLLRCSHCGCAITTSHKTKHYKKTNRDATYVYLHCTKRRGNCDEEPITLESFEEQLKDIVLSISLDKEVWSLGVELLKEKHKHETEANINNLGHLQELYKGFQEKLNRLVDMRASEELTREEFIYQKETLLKEQAGVKSLLDDNEQTSHNWLELAEDFLNTAFYARDIIQDGDYTEKRNLIMAVGENLFLDNKKLDFSFKKPYDILLKPEYRSNGLPLIGTFINNPSSQYLDKQSENMLQSLLAYQQSSNSNYLTAN